MKSFFTFRLFALTFILMLTANLVAAQIIEDFITTWEVTDDDLTVSISIWNELEYNYSINWGDGTRQSTQTGRPEHTYSSAGTYTVKISGVSFPGFRLVQDATRQIRTVEQWGDNRWETFEDAFKDCGFLVINATDAPRLGSVRSMDSMFEGAGRLTGDFSDWNTGQVTSMESMFNDAAAFNADLSNWDVGNVTNMRGMFNQASSFNSDLSDWDVSNVTDMSFMFNQATVFNSDLNDWDVSKVTDMEFMFNNTEAFNSDLDGWDTGNVTIVTNMFDGATAFNGNLSNWNLTKVTSLEKMFFQATAFNGDVSGWKVQNVTDMISMFQEAAAFDQPMNDWDVSSVTDMTNMFYEATSFNQNLDNWNTESLTTVTSLFEGASSFNGNVSTWDVSKISSTKQMFKGAVAFNSDLSAWKPSSLTSMSFMFAGATAFNADISGWNLSGRVDMSGAFSDLPNFNQPIGKWNLELVGTGTFANASSFDQDLSNWNLESVSSLGGIFVNSGMSTKNYNATLFGWSQQSLRTGVTLAVDGLEYCNIGEEARQKIIDDFGWTFSGDSKIECTPILFAGVKDSDTQLTVVFDTDVTTNGGNPTDFDVRDAFDNIYAVGAQMDGVAGDSLIVLTIADISSSVGDLTVTYTNNNTEIKDFAFNQLVAAASSVVVDTDTEAPQLVSAVRDSDTQITLTFNEPVQTNEGGLFAFTVTDDDENDFEVTVQVDGTARDNKIVLTVADMSSAVGLLNFEYVNNLQIADFGENALEDASALICADGFTCNLITKTLCTEESYTLNGGQVVINPEQLVHVDTVGTVITQYRFTLDESIDCCPDGFTCDIIDLNSCEFPYISPLGNTTSVEGRVIDMDNANQIRNTYNVTFNRAEVTSDVFQNAIIAESGSVTYQSNTNATGVLSFDKSLDYWVNMNALQDDLNGTSRSIFMWIKSEASVSGSAQILFGINPANNGNTITNLFIDDNGDNLEINDGGTSRSASFNVSGEVWNYVGYTYDASTNETVVYVNGIENLRYTNNQLTTADSRYSLGQEFDSNESNHYNGDMAEISVWNEVLTGAEIQIAMQAKINNGHPKFANLVGYYSVFGDCADDVAVLKDHSGNDNDGVFQNGFTQDFQNVQSVDGFNAIDWYESLSWKKDGAEVSTTNTYTTAVAAGNYEFTAQRNFIQSTDTWTMTLNGNATTVDLIADETLCADNAITRTVPTNTVNYLDFEETEDNYIEVNSVVDDVAGKDRSVFMWLNKESNIGSGDFNEVLVFQSSDVDNLSRFYIRDTERLALWDGTNGRLNSSTLSNDTWYFVGYTYDHTTGEAKLYVNGNEEDSGMLDMPLGAGWFATLGAKYNDNGLEDHLDGKLAEITLWDKVLSQEEVTSLMAAAPAHNATNLVAAYGTLKSIADNQLRDLTANGNDGLASHNTIIVNNLEESITDYDATVSHTFSWKKVGAEFDTDALGNITIDEGTTAYSVTYGTPLFQKTDDFSLSYTNLLATQPTDQTAGVTSSATFEVDEIAGASYQWYQRDVSTTTLLSQSGASNSNYMTGFYADGDKLYAGTLRDGLFISTDGGVTWTNTTSGQNGFAITTGTRGIYADGDKVYVAAGNGGLSISTDGGATWATTTLGENGLSERAITSIYVVEDMVYAGTQFGGFCISTDGGANWSIITSGQNGFANSDWARCVYAVGDEVYVGTNAGLSISSDRGATWTTTIDGQNGYSDDGSTQSVYVEGDKVYAGTENGFSLSTDGGATWVTTTSGQNGFANDNDVQSVFAVGDKVYAGTQAGGMSISIDGGATWATITSEQTGFANSNSVTTIYVEGDKVYAGTLAGLSILQNRLLLQNESENAASNQIQGATTHQLTINNLSLDQNDTEYFVEVTKDGCTQASDDVTLTVLDVPVATSFTPENGSIDIAIDTELSMEFSKTVTAGTGELKIFNYATDALIQTFTAADLTIDGNTVSISSGVSLGFSDQYYITLSENLVQDASNAGNLAVTGKDTWSFHTICEPLILTEPEDQSGLIAGSASFSVPEVAGASYQWYKSNDRTEELNDFGSNIGAISTTSAGVFVSTASGLYRSLVNGQNFIQLNDSTNIRAVLEKNGVLYVAYANGLGISTDNGDSFEAKNKDNSDLLSDDINNVAVFDNKLYLSINDASTNGGLAISTDNGNSFEIKTSSDGLGSNEVYDVFAEGDNIYVATKSGLSISTNAGASFENRTANDGLSSNTVSDVVVSSDGTIYVGSLRGLDVSTDGGNSFVAFASEEDLITPVVRDLRIVNGTLYISVRTRTANVAGIYTTTDAGETLNTIYEERGAYAPQAFDVLDGLVYAGGAGQTLVRHFTTTALETGADAQADNYITGSTGAILTLSNLTAEIDQSDYFVIVTKGDCEETSQIVTLSIVEGISVVATSPAADDTDVAIDADLSITYDLPFTKGSGSLHLMDYNTDAEIAALPVASATVTDKTLTFSGAPLQNSTLYYVTLDEGLVIDAANNSSPALSGKESWSFETICEPLILSPLEDQSGFVGGEATFSVPEVAGASYQWFGGESRITAVDLSDSGSGPIAGASISGNNRYVAREKSFYVSTDNGATYEEKGAEDGLDADEFIKVFEFNGSVYVAGEKSLFVSNDNGQSFQEIFTIGTFIIDLFVDSDGIYVATASGLGISTDNGASFETKTTADGLAANYLRAVYKDDDTLYLGTNDQLSVSTDNGETFEIIKFHNNQKGTTTDIFTDDGVLYVTTTQGLYISRDNGDSFSRQNQTEGFDQKYFTLVGLSHDGVIVVGTTNSGGLFRTLDGGQSFTLLESADRYQSHNSIFISSGKTYLTAGSQIGELEPIVGLDDKQDGDNTIAGTTTNRLILSNLTADFDQTQYFVKVSKGACEEVSRQATLSLEATPLLFTALSPADDAVDVGVRPELTITFDQAIAKGTGNIEIRRASDDQLLVEVGANTSLVTVDDQTATIALGDINLELDTEYYITIPNTAFEGTTGTAFAGISDKTTWSFTTAGPLALVSRTPVNGATNVTENAFTMVFNYPVERSYPPTAKLFRAADDTQVGKLFFNSPDLEFSEDGRTASFFFTDDNDEDIDLELSTAYYITMENFFISSLTGEFFSLTEKTDWTFTTAETNVEPLLYTSTNPSATRDALIDFPFLSIQFNEQIAIGSGQISIYRATDNSLFETLDIATATIKNSGSPLQAQLELSQNWEAGVSYYIQYPKGLITSLDGTKEIQAIDDNTTISFKAEDFNENIITGFFPATGSSTYEADSEDDFKLFTSIGLGLERDPLGSFKIYKAANDELVKTIEQNGENKRDLSYGDDEPVIRFEFDNDELEPSTEYYVLVDDGFIVSYENAQYHVGISDPNIWRFTTLALPSTPTLVSSSPAVNATNVPVTANIELTYSENIQANANNVILLKGASLAEAFPTNTLTYSGSKVIINPSVDLEYNSNYTVLIQDGAFISNNGVTTEEIDISNAIGFTTVSQPNTAPVASVQDITGSLEVNQALTGSYTYTDADTDTESGTTYQWYVADDASGANSTAISGATLQNYTLTTSEIGKFVALAITPNDGADAGTEVFTTYKGAVVAAVIPTVVSSVPADGAVDVAIADDLNFVLSETVTKGTGSITITPASGTATVIDVTSTEVTVSGANVTINPSSDLLEGQFYTVTFDAAAFVDADGNNSAGLASQTLWNFTTIEPNVAPEAQGVSIKQSIVVTEMLEGSYTFFDDNGDTESGTTYQWYRSDDASGTSKTAISGATSQNYTAVNDDNGKFVSFEVTPSDGILSGTATESNAFGPVLIDDGMTNIPPAYTSDALTSILDNANYSYTITFEDRNNDVPTLTKTTGPAWLSVSGFDLAGNPGAANIGDHSVILTLDDQNGGTVTQEFTVTVLASNVAPTVNGIEITGTTTIDEQLTGSYNFVDEDGDADNSTYKWYRADDASGAAKAAISGATTTTYTLTANDAGKHISFEVTPNDGTVDGTLDESSAVGAVAKKVPTLALTDTGKTYGDADFDLVATTNSSGTITYSFDNDPTSANLSGATVTLGNVGEITVDVALAEDAEYQSRAVQGTITIAKRIVEVTATNASKNVGANDPTLEFTVTSGSIVGSDEVVTVSRDAGEAVGTYAMTFTDGTDAGNYEINTVDGVFTINSIAISVAADAAAKTYGDADPAFTYSVTSGALNAGDQLNGAITRAAGENVGTYALQSSLFNADYDITFVPANLTIGKADLTATADDQSKFLGEPNPAFTISYTGFVNGDSETDITTPTAATTADENSAVGTYDITLSGGAASNYNLSLANGTLSVQQRPFITTWEITSGQVNRSRTYFRSNSDYTFNYNVDWGDGNVDTGLTGDANHTYTAEDSYTIKITGDFPKLEFGQSSVTSIDQWGDIEWESMENALIGASTFTLNATDAPDLTKVTSMSAMFERTQVGNPDLTGWDVSTITDMSEMFLESDFNGNISSWDVSSVTNMSAMFQETENFNGEIGSWNTSSVTNMASMFNVATAFNQPINDWNVSNVTDVNAMFLKASTFNQDLNLWDVSNVTDMSQMFSSAEVFNGSISVWNVSQVTDMERMFSSASAFNQDIDVWDVSSVTRMNTMFNRANSFNQDLNSWDVSNVESFTSMFQSNDIFNGQIGNWDVSNATRMERMFEDAHAFNQDISNWQPTKAENLTAMFRDARVFNQDIGAWRFPNADRINQMFWEAAAFNQDLSTWETGNIVDMSAMFEDALAFNQDIGDWDLNMVRSIGGMFEGATAFNQDISDWQFSESLSSMSDLFKEASAFDQDLSAWDITNITRMGGMFDNAGMSISNYDATLIGWAAQEVQDDVELGVEGLQFCAGYSARQSLMTDHNWTIADDSQSCTATVTIADVSGNEDDGNITVTLTVDAFVAAGFTVDVSTADGTATAGTDYTAVTSQTITFAGTVGETQTFTISPTADTDVEGNETLTVSMGNLVTGANNTVTITNEATVTINDDDEPVVAFTSTTTSNSESTTNAAIEVSLNQVGLTTATVDYAVTGTATGAGTDYTLGNGTLTFTAGDMSESINLAIIDDALIEADQTVIITLSNVSGASLGTNSTFTYTIENNDAQVTIADVSQLEDGESFLVTATLEGTIAGGFTVDVATADGTATVADSDYTALSGSTLTFNGSDGETQTFDISPGADTKLEANETFTVSMSNLAATSADVVITDQATMTITNDDAAAVTIADAAGNEGDGPITVTATLDNAVQGGFTVAVATTDGTATVADNDYTAIATQTLTFAGTAGETQTFTVSPTDDVFIEGDETLTVSLSGLSTSLGVDISDGATVTITNDDFNNAPTDVTLSATSIDENNALNATIGSLSTTDADAGDSHIYSLVTGTGSADNGFFFLEGTELKSSIPSFNFEFQSAYTIRVQTDDGKGGIFAKAIAISINDVNEAPFQISLSNNTIDESDEAQDVGMLMTLDPDADETFTYAFVEGEQDAHNVQFEIVGNMVRTAGAIDFEEGATRDFRVRVTDSGGLTFEWAFTVIIEDVAAEPVRPFTQDAPGADVKNVFSPNGDGVNETWVIEDLLDNPFNEVKIFAQGGKLIYGKVNYGNDWAGTFRDNPVPDGTYYYEITIFENSGDTTPARVIKGFLTIIRNR